MLTGKKLNFKNTIGGYVYKIISKGLNQPDMVPLSYNIDEMIQKDPDCDYYEGFYIWNEEHKKKFDEVGSFKGFTGAITKKLVFDFDSVDQVEFAQRDTQTLVKRLVDNGIPLERIPIFFSGNKGFHVEFNTDETFNRAEFTAIVKGLAGDLETFDPKIVNETRIFRSPLTRNVYTGGFKIPITYSELLNSSVDDIKEKSANALNNWDALCNLMKDDPIPLTPQIKAFKFKAPKERKQVEVQVSDEKPDMRNRPKHMTPARYALQQGFFEPGERNEAYMILCATYKAQGFDEKHTWRLLKGVDELQSTRTGQEEKDPDYLWNNIVQVVYAPTWRGAIYSEKENELLIKTIQRYQLQVDDVKETKVSLITDVSTRFTNFAENIDKNRILTGIPYIDEDVILTTGMLVGWLGAPSSGKTSHVLNIIEHNAMNGNHCFFGSHDMYDSLLYTRMLQKYANLDMLAIVEMMKKRTPSKELRNAFDTVAKNFANVGFNFQSGPTVDDIGRSIDEYQNKTGEKVRLVVIDYLEKMAGQYSDATANSGYNAARLSDLAKDKEVCLILLLQPQKSAGDPSDPLLSYRKIKGASVIEQDARVIFTNWRPGFNPNNDNVDDNYASIAVVKNNMGPVGKYDFCWDGIAGRIRPMNADEEKDYNRVVQEADVRKKKTEDIF